MPRDGYAGGTSPRPPASQAPSRITTIRDDAYPIGHLLPVLPVTATSGVTGRCDVTGQAGYDPALPVEQARKRAKTLRYVRCGADRGADLSGEKVPICRVVRSLPEPTLALPWLRHGFGLASRGNPVPPCAPRLGGRSGARTVAGPPQQLVIPSATGRSEPHPPGRSRRRMRVCKTLVPLTQERRPYRSPRSALAD